MRCHLDQLRCFLFDLPASDFIFVQGATAWLIICGGLLLAGCAGALARKMISK